MKLTVTDDDGATDTVSHDVTVTARNAKPTAAFTSEVKQPDGHLRRHRFDRLRRHGRVVRLGLR